MKVGICTLGCKVNIYESEFITSLLKKNNYEIVPFNELADIYIINTCTVTNTSDSKSRKMVHHAKKTNKDALIIVMGCHIQINPNDIEADIIIGNKDKSKIIELINEYQNNNKKIKKIYNLDNEKFESMEIKKFNNHTRAFVKIQDGCNAFCSYCIIPYARGPIRSKEKSLVIKEVTNLVNLGYKEIILTGIHTGKYGSDINSSLEELLNELVLIKNLYRLRISSIEINEVSDNIIKLIKENKLIARHLHIPLQSGSDKILKLMNRKYLTDFYFNRITTIRKEIPNISITTDLIVGFPNESVEDFNETINFIKKTKFTKIHVFPYSKRDNTEASLMKNQIPENIKKDRVREIIKLSNELENNYYKLNINKYFEVIIERYKNYYSYGMTSNYIPIKINREYKSNDIVNIKIKEIKNNIGISY